MHGGVISHTSGKQGIVTLSSMEAEYYAITFAAQEPAFLRKLAKSVNLLIKGPIKLFTDS